MTVDYIVASLPALVFGAAAPMTREKFAESTGYAAHPPAWTELETQLRNAMAEARGGERKKRPAQGCSVYWKNRVLACFQERDIAKREELLDRVWWDAAGELTPLCNPLSAGALATYAVRLEIALKRGGISIEKGNAAFDRLTEETKS
jgi:hypothetical protein